MNKQRGFTLIEMLVVITILAVLMSVMISQVFNKVDEAKDDVCLSLIRQVEGAARQHEVETGDYPKDLFGDLKSKYRLPGNRENEGIEALLVDIATTESASGVGFIDELEANDRFSNFDEDKAGTSLGRVGTNQLYEIKDPWGFPLVYFHHRNYNKSQTVTLPLGEGEYETVLVKPVLHPKTGRFREAHRFQLISAGADGIFGTVDDIRNFKAIAK